MSSAMASSLRVRRATDADAEEVVRLVNGAYRGENGAYGWTSEHELVAGARIDPVALRELMARPGGVLLVAERDGALVGCAHVQRLPEGAAEIGMLAVRVAGQRNGAGRAILEQAEAHARDAMGATLAVLHVITARRELAAWYERRGYVGTGVLREFVGRRSELLVRGPLLIERLEKPL